MSQSAVHFEGWPRKPVIYACLLTKTLSLTFGPDSDLQSVETDGPEHFWARITPEVTTQLHLTYSKQN